MPNRKQASPAGALYGGRLNRIPQYIADQAENKPRYSGMAMSVEDMADELAIGRNVAYDLVRQPGFPSFMIGRRVLVSRKGLQDWIDKQCKKGSGTTVITEAPEP